MKQIPTHFAAKIGLDWADRKHDFCLKSLNSDAFEFGTFEHNPEKIDA